MIAPSYCRAYDVGYRPMRDKDVAGRRIGVRGRDDVCRARARFILTWANRTDEATLDLTGESKLSGACSRASEEDAGNSLLDAVWDVPVGLGVCDAALRFLRVNDALAEFDGLPVAAHYQTGDTLARLPVELAEGLRGSASGEALDVEFVSKGRCIFVKCTRSSGRAIVNPSASASSRWT